MVQHSINHFSEFSTILWMVYCRIVIIVKVFCIDIYGEVAFLVTACFEFVMGMLLLLFGAFWFYLDHPADFARLVFRS